MTIQSSGSLREHIADIILSLSYLGGQLPQVKSPTAAPTLASAIHTKVQLAS
jgi:hypothetical protein